MTRTPVHAGDLASVALGAALGALARWLVGQWLPVGDGFPWSTFAVNVTGCLALGALPLLAVVRRRHRVALLLGPGVLGGFTTVSAWAGEARALADRPALALTYVLGTLAAALVAAAAGRRLSHRPEPEDATT